MTLTSTGPPESAVATSEEDEHLALVAGANAVVTFLAVAHDQLILVSHQPQDMT